MWSRKGGKETEIRRRIQAGSRKVEEVMGDCLPPIGCRDYSDDTKQLEKLHVDENNWVRRIAGMKRIDKRILDQLREEVSVRERESLTRKLMRKRLKWAGHLEIMKGERLKKRADSLRVEGRRRRGRPRLKWDDCVKRDLACVGGEWRMRTRDGGVETVETTVKWCQPRARDGATPLAGSWFTTWSHYCDEY